MIGLPNWLNKFRRVVSGGGGGGADTTTGLIGWWKLDASSGTLAVDSSASANDGTLVNAPAWVPAHINNGLQFTAASSQKVTANTTAIGGLTKASLTAWMNRSSSGDIVAFGAGSNGYGDTFNVTWYLNDTIYFRFGNGDTSMFASVALAGTGWHHVALVFDGTQSSNATRIIAYIDGVAQTLSFNFSTPTALASSGAMGNFVMGNDAAGAAANTGILDDVRLYNRPLAPADVAALAAM